MSGMLAYLFECQFLEGAEWPLCTWVRDVAMLDKHSGSPCPDAQLLAVTAHVHFDSQVLCSVKKWV